MPWCDSRRAMAGTLNFSKYKTSQHSLYLYLICFLVITKSINKTMFKLEFWVISRLSKGLKIYWAYMFWFLLAYWDESPNCLWEQQEIMLLKVINNSCLIANKKWLNSSRAWVLIPNENTDENHMCFRSRITTTRGFICLLTGHQDLWIKTKQINTETILQFN